MSTASADDPVLTIEVAAALGPGRVDLTTLRLPAGSSVADALRASGLAERIGAAAIDALTPGIRGRVCDLHAVLRDGDRVELTRPLAVDPKEARRLRYRRDGLRRPVKRRA
jgi:putative ubiquitin-RnfH superfamily antitoxin RatB of RatAB toxin-antitoxin module